MDGIENILKCVWGMSIVNKCGNTFCRAYRLKSACHALQCAESNKNILRILTEHNGCSIYCEKVADIELANELHAYFLAVNLKIHTLEMALYDLGMEICHSTDRVSLNGSLSVLNHYHTVLVIGIGDCKGILRHIVEELLLCITIVLQGLVIVEMITCKVCEDTTGKSQSTYTLLGDSMT